MSCSKCERQVKRKYCYNCATKYKCVECKRTFFIKENYEKHTKSCQSKNTYGLINFDPFILSMSAFRQFLVVYTLSDINFIDIDGLYSEHKITMENLLFYVYEYMKSIKFQICVHIHFIKPNDSTSTKTHICSSMKTMTSPWNAMNLFNECRDEINATIDAFTHKGSGWTIDRITTLEIRIAKYIPDSGGCADNKLPPMIKNKGALISFDCKTDCFIYCVLAALYPEDKNPQRYVKYQKYLHHFDFKEVKGHVQITDIPKFEKKNEISINIYSLDFKEDYIIPLQLSKYNYEKNIKMFLYSNHFYLIKNFDRLINTKDEKATKRCYKCLQGFSNIVKRNLHEESCMSKQLVILPEPNEKLYFKKYTALEKYPFIVYADFETLATKLQYENKNTFEYQKHIPSSFGLAMVDWKGDIIYSKFYRGKDASSKFFDEINLLPSITKQIYEANVRPLSTTQSEDEGVQNTKICWICQSPFKQEDIKVRDHNHLTGELRGAAHQSCNLELCWNEKIPIVFHNLKNFDGHILIQAMNKNNTSKVTVIPNTTEKYSAIFTKNFIFIDSYAFLASSLDNLSSNLDDATKHRYLSQIFPNDKIDLLMRKGALPYEYIDEWSKFDDSSLPPIDKFHSSLTNSSISEEVYIRLQSIWKQFNCENLGAFQDIYLKVDVVLLAAIFERFRESCHKEFSLDPAHYVSIPGLSWDSALRMTKASLDLLTDIDMVTMIEKGIRGGISCAMTHHAKANNPKVPNYNPNEPNTFITYLDVNNLYGWALKQKLPTHNFEWVDDFDKVIEKIKRGDTDKGYILEVDLHYPSILHDWHDDYPLAPEKLVIHDDLLSQHQKQILQIMNDHGRKRISSEKLVPNLMDKSKYVIYYKNLKYYLDKGLQLTNIHRIIAFDETAWLEPYIMMCTSKRQKATNAFEKDLYKLMVNSLYGKSIEDKRKHSKVKIPMSRKLVQWYTRNPLFDQFIILDEDKAICKLGKDKVVLDKPIHMGFTVLEYAKLKMYQLHYDTFKAHYGNNIKLIYTDTDSFIYHVTTNDFESDFYHFADIMDFCDYPKGHPLQSYCHKKMLGFLKDEMNGKSIHEVIAIKPKMYLIKSDEGDKKTAKGVQRAVLKQQIQFENYRSCLYDFVTFHHTMHRLQSRKHDIFAIETNKVSLSPLDDKRWSINAIETYAYGNHNIMDTDV